MYGNTNFNNITVDNIIHRNIQLTLKMMVKAAQTTIKYDIAILLLYIGDGLPLENWTAK